ncbi:MAG TPA: hypothetical protein VJY62_18705 [Bacteroidia bacterium]|nr:hypothetical protein [Bacteroidia bacterium]
MRKKEDKQMQFLSIMFTNMSDTRTLMEKYASYKKMYEEYEVKFQKAQEWKFKQYDNGRKHTVIKENFKSRLIDSSLTLMNVVLIHARVTGNKALQNAVRYSYSDLFRSVPDVLIGRCQQIINAAKRVKNYEEIGLEKSQVEEAEELFGKYKKCVSMPQLHKKKRAYYGKQCRKCMRECRLILQNKIIPFFLVIRERHKYETLHFFLPLERKKRGRKKKTYHVAVNKQNVIVSNNKLNLVEMASELLKKEKQQVLTEAAANL